MTIQRQYVFQLCFTRFGLFTVNYVLHDLEYVNEILSDFLKFRCYTFLTYTNRQKKIDFLLMHYMLESYE